MKATVSVFVTYKLGILTRSTIADSKGGIYG